MRRILVTLVAAVAAFVPAAAFAQEAAPSDGGFVMIVDQEYVLPAGEAASTVLVIGGDAEIQGTVEDALIVIAGDATIRGTVLGDLTVIRGDANLLEFATVADVHLVEGDLVRSPGATVTGDVDESAGWAIASALAVTGLFVVLGMTVALLVGGVVFAAIAARQLTDAVGYMATRPGPTVVAGLLVAVGLPVIAGMLIATVVGIPTGVGLLVFLGPALVFLGYIVAGAWLGTLILRRGKGGAAPQPFAEVLLGLLILQAMFVIPFVGALLFIALGLWGTGALTYVAWRGFRPGRLPAQTAPAAPGGGQPIAG